MGINDLVADNLLTSPVGGTRTVDSVFVTSSSVELIRVGVLAQFSADSQFLKNILLSATCKSMTQHLALLSTILANRNPNTESCARLLERLWHASLDKLSAE
ncbi:hypothetical protein NC652_021644 [Populus alba x Populus x berolinensis]|nr:hypothetical protein NC652_021644 [Populus alba x Populus x berolinensis]